ncbi:NB-ARC domain-containing protein [Mycena venus]|uniref:NB-ARC domain-containing protein n=1 Tax=Mycena venus TaxID=2733690 RepID=A0A8H7CZQ9_9AGAR|nr:NB-ARC domain-containing protein [Mycena venus]
MYLQIGTSLSSTLFELEVDAEERHQELLELLSLQSASEDATSLIGRSSMGNSSGSLSLLPASPQIFHGREAELDHILKILLRDSARVAILGPGGMGKTTLAMAVLHQEQVIAKYPLQHFISCESANSVNDLVRTLGLHLGIEPSRDLSKLVVQNLRECGLCLLVLDNFETPWESLGSRGPVEEFLSLLADIPGLALLITMRGLEHPGKVKWTRPFLPALQPLSQSDTREIFVEIAQEPHADDVDALNELLELSGSLPLAASLMASIASFEGYLATLSRWKMESTALLSQGADKRSNLEKSIMLSLHSPRFSASIHAKELLSLLSILPDGITHDDLRISRVPIPNLMSHSSTLLQTSLAYMDAGRRLRTLSPIREFIRKEYPPTASISKPLREYYRHLLQVVTPSTFLSLGNIVSRITLQLGNIHNILLQALMEANSSLVETGLDILKVHWVSDIMLQGASPLIQRVPHLIELTGNTPLWLAYNCHCLRTRELAKLPADPDQLIAEGLEFVSTVHLPTEEGMIHC